MSADSLGAWLLGQPKFTAAFKRISDASIAREFPGLVTTVRDLEGIDWDYMVFAASVLARAETGSAQEAALRIAQTGFAAGNEVSDACAVVLDSMSNRKSVELAVSRGLVPENIEGRLG
ncbi:MAG: hypothetical protein ABL889_20100, partial [Terricaulis sp.]